METLIFKVLYNMDKRLNYYYVTKSFLEGD